MIMGVLKMKTEVSPYRRISAISQCISKIGGSRVISSLLSRENLILAPLAFLLGRAALPGGMLPFGIAVYTATYGTDVNRVLVGISALMGMLTMGFDQQLYVAAAAMLLFNTFMIPGKGKKQRSVSRMASASMVSVLIPQILIIYLQGFLLFDILKSLLFSFIVLISMFIFKKSVLAVINSHNKGILSNEEIISFSIIAALSFAGLGNLSVLGLGIKNVLSVLIILLFSYKSGAGAGSAIGVVVGLIISMSAKVSPVVIGSYAFCGLLAGVLRNLGKVGCSLGFVLGNTIITLYLNGSTDVLIYLKESIIAVLLFFIIPARLAEILTGVFGGSAIKSLDKMGYSFRIKEITVEKLNKFSQAFKELSKTFREISQTTVATNKGDITSLFDRVAERVCKDCSLCLYCWDRNFYNTYQVMFKIIEKLDSKGRIENNDIPSYFLEHCERIEDFVEAVNNMYEVFKVDMVWKNRIGESRTLVSQQLDGLSTVISNLANEIDLDVRFKSDIEDKLIVELNKANIRVNDVIVFENKWRKYEISVFHKGCGGKRSCLSVIEKVVSNTVGRQMCKEGSGCYQRSRNGTCALKLIEEETYKITTGVARMPKYEGTASGDSYTFMSTGDGKYILGLSDGMGSGQRAAIHSKAAMNLLEQFMETGFDKDTAVKIINSILVLKSNDDSFATLDISIIDLYDGEAEFVKIGAAATYIKREERLDIIKSVSLPAGIMSEFETELMHMQVGNGDIIIMVTDGVEDAFKEENSPEAGLQLFLKEMKGSNPQQLADDIMKKAFEACGGKPLDDMTVLVAKVWKKAK